MSDKITVMIAVNGKPHQVTRTQFRRWLLDGVHDVEVLEGEQDG